MFKDGQRGKHLCSEGAVNCKQGDISEVDVLGRVLRIELSAKHRQYEVRDSGRCETAGTLDGQQRIERCSAGGVVAPAGATLVKARCAAEPVGVQNSPFLYA